MSLIFLVSTQKFHCKQAFTKLIHIIHRGQEIKGVFNKDNNLIQVIVPVFGDQPANGQEAEIKGYGLSVSLVDLKADDLYNAIRYNNLLTMLDQW